MPYKKVTEEKTFWERHQTKFSYYGQIIAVVSGIAVIDYVPEQKSGPWLKRIRTAYSHITSVCLVVILPIYFGYNYERLIAISDQRLQLQLYVSFCSTLMKYLTVIVTIITNMIFFTAIIQCNWVRLRLDAAFAKECNYSMRAMKHFAFLIYFKIISINAVLIIQILCIFASPDKSNANPVRMHFSLYGLILWNYMENMADYFFYININVLKYYQQLHEQIQALLLETKLLHNFRMCQQRRGTLIKFSILLCERLAAIRRRFSNIFCLYGKSFVMQQFQILGIVLNTLATNLTNSYTVFNLLANHSIDDIIIPAILSTLYALCYLADTYIITMVTEHIRLELLAMSMTIRQFSQVPTFDVRLEKEIENFLPILLSCRESFTICGLFTLDRSLVFAMVATGFSYFITLVQFDLILRRS